MKNLRFLLVLNIFLFSINIKSQNQLHTIEVISNLRNSEPKNFVIFIHADWCKFCPIMKNYLSKNEEIKKILNDAFYFADLNSEEKRQIIFNGEKFNYQPTGINTGLHQLVVSLGTANETISYPTLIILNPKNEIIFQYNGFLKANEILEILEKLK